MRQTIVKYAKGFHVLVGDSRSQAASMVIEPGEKEGGPGNSHKGADQWLYVESGKGEATINGHVYPLQAGSLLLIERGDKHEIRNTATTAMRTLNVYSPPAYAPDGDELPAGKEK
jgi:quercetin dioxygenase-like cupin family protein